VSVRRAFAGGGLAALFSLTAAGALATEPNAAGDIPDTQAFVVYRAPGSYSVEAPEGWARSVRGATVTFSDKLDGESVSLLRHVRQTDNRSELALAARDAQGVRKIALDSAILPAGRATLLKYTSDSQPNPITGRRVRLENARFIFRYRDRVARLTLWAPVGADNADQWRRIAQSFRWER
jgi:hypothetical protein